MKRRNFLKITLPILATNQLMASEPTKETPEVSFGVIADPQYADVEPKGTRFYRNSLKKLGTAITELNKHELDFTVTLGDVIDRDFKSFADIMPIYKKAKAPQTYVYGNHDFEVADEDKEKVREALGKKHDFDSETVGNWMFIYLDGTKLSTYRYAKGSQLDTNAKSYLATLKKGKKPQAQTWNGGVNPTQLKWLKSELTKAKESNKRVIIFNHYPVIPVGNAHNLWNDEAVVNLITEHPNVVAYMNGHNHKGNYTTHKGCHFVNFKGMVETEKSAPFGIVRCYSDRIEIDGYDTEPDRNLTT